MSQVTDSEIQSQDKLSQEIAKICTGKSNSNAQAACHAVLILNASKNGSGDFQKDVLQLYMSQLTIDSDNQRSPLTTRNYLKTVVEKIGLVYSILSSAFDPSTSDEDYETALLDAKQALHGLTSEAELL